MIFAASVSNTSGAASDVVVAKVEVNKASTNAARLTSFVTDVYCVAFMFTPLMFRCCPP